MDLDNALLQNPINFSRDYLLILTKKWERSSGETDFSKINRQLPVEFFKVKNSTFLAQKQHFHAGKGLFSRVGTVRILPPRPLKTAFTVCKCGFFVVCRAWRITRR
jgi:hypothetical protein